MPGLYYNAPLNARTRERRNELGLKQMQVAEAAGISVETVRRVEQGVTRRPRDHELIGIARALKVEPEYLLGHPLGIEPPEHQLPAISPEDERLMRVLRGPLHGARPFLLKLAELPAFDQRLVLDTLEFCEARIDAANDWERRRRSRAERDTPNDTPARNGSLDHAGA